MKKIFAVSIIVFSSLLLSACSAQKGVSIETTTEDTATAPSEGVTTDTDPVVEQTKPFHSDDDIDSISADLENTTFAEESFQ